MEPIDLRPRMNLSAAPTLNLSAWPTLAHLYQTSITHNAVYGVNREAFAEELKKRLEQQRSEGSGKKRPQVG